MKITVKARVTDDSVNKLGRISAEYALALGGCQEYLNGGRERNETQ